ncbi:MAG: Gfo/Idh/MocA family oxidoreductase [bacterium]|nr:Gfo/Idh/MocA family oxidoreductase [bacterium]
MDKVKVAFIGAGGMANAVHYPSLAEIEIAKIVGISDLIEEKMRQTAEKYKIEKTFTNYKELIEKTSPDAVYIIMPPHHLFDIAAYCLSLGLHIFVEKPPGITKEQTRQLANLAEKKGALTMTGFQRRFSPVIKAAKKRIDERGGILHCQANFFKNYIDKPPYYNGAIDILSCDAIHSVDILRWMAGEPRKISSIVRSIDASYDNCFYAMIDFESGASGFLSANWVSGKRIYNVEMHGKGICAFADPEESAVVYKDGSNEGEIIKAKEIAGSDQLFKFAGFYDENRHFIECIRDKKLPQTHFGDSVKTMELVDRIYHSIM